MKFTKLNYVKRGEVTRAVKKACPTATFPEGQNKDTLTIWLQEEDLPALDAVARALGLPKPFHPHCGEIYSKVREIWLFKDDANLAANDAEWAQVRDKENDKIRKLELEEIRWYEEQGKELPIHLEWRKKKEQAHQARKFSGVEDRMPDQEKTPGEALYTSRNSFVEELKGPLDNLSEEVSALLAQGLSLDPDAEGYGLDKLEKIPEEQLVFSGHISGATNFLEDLMGSAAWECTLYVQPLAQAYFDRGIHKPLDRFKGTTEATDILDEEVSDALPQCSFVLAIRIHSMNYLMKGNLLRGVTWQGWEI